VNKSCVVSALKVVFRVHIEDFKLLDWTSLEIGQYLKKHGHYLWLMHGGFQGSYCFDCSKPIEISLHYQTRKFSAEIAYR
jgi:hypothetical protein